MFTQVNGNYNTIRNIVEGAVVPFTGVVSKVGVGGGVIEHVDDCLRAVVNRFTNVPIVECRSIDERSGVIEHTAHISDVADVPVGGAVYVGEGSIKEYNAHVRDVTSVLGGEIGNVSEGSVIIKSMVGIWVHINIFGIDVEIHNASIIDVIKKYIFFTMVERDCGIHTGGGLSAVAGLCKSDFRDIRIY